MMLNIIELFMMMMKKIGINLKINTNIIDGCIYSYIHILENPIVKNDKYSSLYKLLS